MPTFFDTKSAFIRTLFDKPYRTHEYNPIRSFKPRNVIYGDKTVKLRVFQSAFVAGHYANYSDYLRYPRNIDLSGWYITFNRMDIGTPVFWLPMGTYGFHFHQNDPDFAVTFDIREVEEPRLVGHLIRGKRCGLGWSFCIDPHGALIERLSEG